MGENDISSNEPRKFYFKRTVLKTNSSGQSEGKIYFKELGKMTP